jgi:hypothetical protein
VNSPFSSVQRCLGCVTPRRDGEPRRDEDQKEAYAISETISGNSHAEGSREEPQLTSRANHGAP